MIIAANSNIGRVRHENQDAYAYFTIGQNLACGVVCDGMGGANGGRFASHNAVQIITESLRTALQGEISAASMRQTLKKAINAANDYLYESSRREESLYGMGTTMVAAIILENDLFIANIGDSRAYLYSDGLLTQLSVDHSAVQQLVDMGKISKEEARTHPRKNLITRAVGVDDFVDFDFYTYTVRSDDRVLLCSDGLSNYCSDEMLQRLMSARLSPTGMTQKLIDFANEKGGGDNITALIIQK